MEALVSCSLMPADEAERKSLETLDPYFLRARALDHALPPHEVGRAMFHLGQRRGFKSNRKSDSANDSEAKKTKADTNELRRRMNESGARTLGEFLFRRHDRQRTVRARVGHGLYPERAMYEAEFDAIRTAQEPHQSLRPDQWDTLKEIIFRQRPLRPVEPGLCLLEPGEKRAERALPVAQEFRMVQEVNNLRVRTGPGHDMRPLTGEERSVLLDKLRTQKEVKFDKLPGILGLSEDTRINLDQWNRKELKGDETTTLLKNKNIFDKRWLSLSFDERTKIAKVLLTDDDPASVHRIAMEQWGLDGNAADRVGAARLPQGHVHLSEKALNNIVPLMEEHGYVYSEAIAAHPDYAHHSDFRPDSALDSLPYYGELLPQQVVGADPSEPESDAPSQFGRIANPTVHIGLGQVRRVVNRLIDIYGKPQHIVVELARDLKMNHQQRQEAERAQKEGGERNDRLRKVLEAAEKTVTGETLRKLRLWEEQGPLNARFCPYTGETISFEMAVSAATEIDHILPISKTLDDSPANQVVCLARANRDKGGRSPYDAFGQSPAGYDYEAIKRRAETIGDTIKKNNKRDTKSRRFFEDAMEWFENEEEFLGRQLNETRYLSRISRTYLAHLFDEKSQKRQFVDATPGRLTAAMRRGWGLNSLLYEARKHGADAPDAKTRDDHRHHAIDAFVIACTTPGTVQNMMRAASTDNRNGTERSKNLAKVAEWALPWKGFSRNDLRHFIDRMVVSHRPDHGTRGVQGKTTGQLHNDTAYGIKDLGDGESPATVVVRKPLSGFSSRKNVEAVRDPALREALLRLWEQSGEKKGSEFAKRAWETGVTLNGRVQHVRSVRVIEDLRSPIVISDRRTGKPYKAYKPDSNEFADIWRLPDGKWRTVVVRKFAANQPGFDIVGYRPHPAAKRLMRLHIDDVGAMGSGVERTLLRVCKLSGESGRELIYLAPHNEANVDARSRSKDDSFKYLVKSAEALRREGFRKVGVDEIGRVLDPGHPR
ncbi:MAG: type II CRISPR RNA-guided endonuclease Cas9 [Proteobacteria bacterium]|nr:type II CRISPR RNA-guided endonuclease Cas9 [Pseudomonadota bacterium]